MQVNVAQLLQAPVGTAREHRLGETDVLWDDGSRHQVKGEVKLLRTQRGIFCEASLETEVLMTCSRCLGDFSHKLKLDIEEEYQPVIDVVTGAGLPAPDEPGTLTIGENHVIDLAEAIRQYAVMATPINPLCREYCAGLCSACGRNLNEGPCRCAPPGVSPRAPGL